MTMAVSAIVRPSRLQRCMLAGAGLAQLAAAFAVGLVAPERFLVAPLLAAALAGAGVVLLGAAAHPPKTHRIDISGTGELRVTVQQDLRVARGGGSGAPAALLPGSVVWPLLMLLRWRAPGGRVAVLHIWRDSVDPAAWRALAVALAAGRAAAVGGTDEKNR